MKIAFIIIFAIHSLIHLMGFVKAFNIGEISQLKKAISRTAGIMWLMSAILFIVSLGLFVLHIQLWWILAIATIVLSQILIIKSWTDAKLGTIANFIILIPVFISFMNSLPSSFENIYKTEAEQRLKTISDTTFVSEGDIKHLPAPVSKYLYYVGAVGKPKVNNFYAVFKGRMRNKMEGRWMNINSQQYNFFEDPARIFYIKSKMLEIPITGLHLYVGNNATMQIKIASLFKVVDAKGENMNQSETVTMFNDMCLMAPSTLIDRKIRWEIIEPLLVKATFTNQDNTITALLYFNEIGELVNFISNDRFYSTDGKTYNNYIWSTPVKDYKETKGRKFPTYGEAIWNTPEGEFTYANFNIRKIKYNCKKFK